MSSRDLRLFLDANILHAAPLRDFILRLAEAGEIEVFWSRPVLEETRRSLMDRGLPADKVNRLIAAIELAFPTAEVQDFGHFVAEMDCPDMDDRHVLAAAVAAERHPRHRRSIGISRQHPGAPRSPRPHRRRDSRVPRPLI